jgi:hypothetical protein
METAPLLDALRDTFPVARCRTQWQRRGLDMAMFRWFVPASALVTIAVLGCSMDVASTNDALGKTTQAVTVAFTQSFDEATQSIIFRPASAITWVDVHVTINGTIAANLRMNPSGANYATGPFAIIAGDAVSYSFTYSVGGSAGDTPDYTYAPPASFQPAALRFPVVQTGAGFAIQALGTVAPAWADAHYSINGGPQSNVRLTSTGGVLSTPLAAQTSDTVSYSMTYSVNGYTLDTPARVVTAQGSAMPQTCASAPLTVVGAIASSEQNDGHFKAGWAVDGNTTTRWSSNFTDQEWIRFDLGAIKTVTRVLIDWERAGAAEYRIDVSDDGAAWTTAGAWSGLTSIDHRIDDNAGLQATGRYVRVYGTKRATQYGYSIWEAKLYGDSSTQCVLPVPDGQLDQTMLRLAVAHDARSATQVQTTFKATNQGGTSVGLSGVGIKYWMYDTSASYPVPRVTKAGSVVDRLGKVVRTVTGVSIGAIRLRSCSANDKANWEVTVNTTDGSVLAAGAAWTGLQTTVALANGSAFAPGTSSWFSNTVPASGYAADPTYGLYLNGKLVASPDMTTTAPVCRWTRQISATPRWTGATASGQESLFGRVIGRADGTMIAIGRRGLYSVNATGTVAQLLPSLGNDVIVDGVYGAYVGAPSGSAFVLYNISGTEVLRVTVPEFAMVDIVPGRPIVVLKLATGDVDNLIINAVRFVGEGRDVTVTLSDLRRSYLTRDYFIYTTSTETIALDYAGAEARRYAVAAGLMAASSASKAFALVVNGTMQVVHALLPAATLSAGVDLGSPVWNLALSPDGHYSVATTENTAYLLRDGALVRTVPIVANYITSADVSNDGIAVLGTQNADSSTALWTVGIPGFSELSLPRPSKDTRGFHPDVRFLPDGRSLVSSERDGVSTFNVSWTR